MPRGDNTEKDPSYIPTPEEIRMGCQRARIAHLKKKREANNKPFESAGEYRARPMASNGKRWNGRGYSS